ncbi:MAG: tetratricopeptide repeat protein [Fibrobacteria bacterium]|nr:tetratricopeptide repeat protein [Fibrobacteria bacterium]
MNIEQYLYVIVSLFILPFYYTSSTIDPTVVIRFIVLSALLILLVLIESFLKFSNAKNATQSIGIPLYALLCGTFLLFSLISLTQATNLAEGFFEFLKSAVFCLYLILSVRILQRMKRKLVLLVKSVIICSFIAAIIGILEYWDFIQIIDCHPFSPGSTFANRNLFSSFLLMTFGFSVYGTLAFKKVWFSLSILSSGFIMYCFLITQTRAVWVAIIFSSIVVLSIIFVGHRKRFRNAIGFKGIRLVSLLLLSMLLFLFHTNYRSTQDNRPPLVQRAITIADTKFDANKQRLVLWEKTLEMIRQNPIFGVGAGNWKVALPGFGLGNMLRTDMSLVEVRPYNDYLLIGSEIGIIGLFFFLSLFVLCIHSAMRIIRDKSRSYHTKLLVSSFLFGISGFLVVMFFDFPEERIEHLVVCGLLLGGIFSLSKKTSALSIKWNHKLTALTSIVVTTFLIACLGFGIMRLNSEVTMIKILAARSSGNWHKVITYSDNIHPLIYSIDHTTTPVAWYKGIALYSLNDFKGALTAFNKAYAVHPNHLHVLNNLGSCHAKLKDYHQALTWYNKALDISPNFNETLLNLAVVFYNTQDYNKALQMILKTEPLENDNRRETYLKAIQNKIKKREVS